MTDSTLDAEIGRRLRQARLAQGRTQKDVADAIGLSHQAYQKYEQGRSRLSVSTLALINGVFSIPLGELLPGVRSDGTTIQSPMAAIGSSIVGIRLANAFAQLDESQQRALLDVAKAMLQRKAAK